MKISLVIAIAIAVAFVLAVARLDYLNEHGPAHSPVTLPGMEPATIYLPGSGFPFFNQFPKPVAERPPVVVLVHGFTADRQTMSTLARRITENGYAAIAIDLSGHGENRNPFKGEGFQASALRSDIKNAVDFLRDYDQVDGSRIVVIGHSMGAGAALDYATHDPSLKGAIMISGGWWLGPERPKNALFIFAEHDPVEAIQDTSSALVAHLAGVPKIEPGKLYGNFADGSAVEAVRVPGVDHARIIYSPDAATTIVKWLDDAFATRRVGAINVSEPRLADARLALGLFVILIVPIGRLGGLMAPAWPEDRTGVTWWIGLLIIGGALIAAMPLIATGPPTAFLSLVVTSIQVSWFWVASLIVIVVLTLWYGIDWPRIRDGLGPTMLAAAITYAILYVCQVAISPTFHNLSLTPERVIAMAIASVLLFPFWMEFELLLRRGSLAISTVVASVGRVMIVALMAIGISVHVLPFVLFLVLPLIALHFVLMEIFAASAYSVSRNLVLIAAVETVWMAWTFAAANPITFMF